MKKTAAFPAAVMLCSKYGFSPAPMFGKLIIKTIRITEKKSTQKL